MTTERIKQLHVKQEVSEMVHNALCYDCHKPTEITTHYQPENDTVIVSGGALYFLEDSVKLKCEECHAKKPEFEEQTTEIYSRVVGYLRPVKNFHEAKRAEFETRTPFKVNE